MSRFLDAQKTVMLAYLGGEAAQTVPAPSLAAPARPTVELPSYAPAPFVHEPVKVYEPVKPAPAVVAEVAPAAAAFAPAPVPEPVPPPPPSGPNQEELTQRLLSIVSERTGYPTE